MAVRTEGAARVSLGHRPALDGVRAVAVLAVLAYHLDYPWARGGFLGVDLFMVLSGFLITSLLLAERDTAGRVALGAFWVRRIRRIIPAVVLVLLGVSAFAAFWASPIELANLRWDSLAALTFWANWRFIESGSGYWAQFGEPSPLTHFWSLAVEEQFYVVWPLVVIVVLAASRGSRRWLIGACAAGIVASVVAMAAFYDAAEPSRAYLGTDTRVHTLLVGALAAMLVGARPGRAIPWERQIVTLGPVAFAAVAVALVLVGDRSPWMYRGGFAAFALVSTVVVVAACSERGLISRALRHRALTWVGLRSFGIYLWHWPLIVILTPDRLGVDGLSRDVILVVLTLVVAELSYRLVEIPIRNVAPSARSLRPVLAGAGAMTVTAALITAATVMPAREQVVLDASDLLSPSEVAPDPLSATDEPSSVAEEPAAVDQTPPPDLAARPPAADAVPEEPAEAAGGDSAAAIDLASASTSGGRRTIGRVLIQGDSVAMFTALPAKEAFAAAGVAVENRTFAGLSLQQPAVWEAIRDSEADLSIWQISLWDVGTEAEQRARYREFVAASFASGMHVIFVDQPPILEELETDERLRLRRIVRELAAEFPDRILVLDPSPVWGPTAELDRDGDGVPERWRDLIHVCPQGSARWTQWLMEELAVHYDGIAPADPDLWLNGTWLDSPKWDENPGQCDPV